PSEDWGKLERVVKDFERAWLAAVRPTLEDYLAAAGPNATLALVELIHVDLEYRLRAGEEARVETYLSDYPDLARDRAAVLDLLAAEYRLRRRREPDLPTQEYLGRFPQYGEALLSRLRGPDDEPTGPNPSTGPTLEPEGGHPFRTAACVPQHGD